MGIFGKKDKTVAKASVAKKTSAVSAPAKKIKSEHTVKFTDRPYRVLLKPLISEKGTFANSLNKYIFMVDVRANKVEIKKAVEELYQVVPVSVNIIRQQGKHVRTGRSLGTRRQYKKAIVTLKKDDTIKLYEGI